MNSENDAMTILKLRFDHTCVLVVDDRAVPGDGVEPERMAEVEVGGSVLMGCGKSSLRCQWRGLNGTARSLAWMGWIALLTVALDSTGTVRTRM
jgi:hypothetical protein